MYKYLFFVKIIFELKFIIYFIFFILTTLMDLSNWQEHQASFIRGAL